MNVIPIGTVVSVGKDIDATVTAVCIRENGVTYECVWFNGRARNCEWINDCEIEVKPLNMNRIGFAVNGHKQ